ncbi:unnamed protein product [Candidula unifasciata]|uniref:Uncharacterized protein n=1 Tax=Candidula unifasciata TaxID=100452 RepID=A0A8S3ZHP3_9EUPU|nr:unnamed protein product [Candidula unifasciata]
MYDQEFDNSAPYDNVEFPIRKPGTGTWPGPGGASGASGAGVKLYGHQTTGRSLGGSKLAPLVEVEGSEGGENNRLQIISFVNTSTTPTTTTAAASQQQQYQGQSKQIAPFVTQQGTNTTPQNQIKVEGTSSTPVLLGVSSSGAFSTITTSLSTTTATATTTTTSTSQVGKLSTEKSVKPVITVPNDSTTYITTQVTSADSPKKKTMKQADADEEDFKRQDLNPGARLALERVYTRHPDFYQLNTKVLDEGSLLKQDVLDIYKKTGETLTYEQLLQGMLVDGERFLLGSCWLYYTHVQFLDVEGARALREPYGRGRIGLTNKRALFLSTETYTDANLEQFEQSSSNKKTLNKPGYKLEVSKRSTITFKNIPINNFHSAEMEVATGTAAQTKITKESGCCGCLGMAGRWVSTPPMTRSINSRVLRVGVSMPPWQTRMFLDIHLDPTMSLTVARDFISQLHTFAPHMH